MAKSETQYTVVGAFPVLDEGHRPGSTFTANIDPELEAFLIDTGMIEKGKGAGDAAAPTKVPCPACVEQGVSRVPKFDDIAGLSKHYADKHPALVPPDELPTAGEEV